MTQTLEYIAPTLEKDYIYTYDVPERLLDEVLGGEKLPEGYGVIGGAARSVAWALLRGEEPPQVRDIDLARSAGADPRLSGELAHRLNPDDAAYGHGVQEIDVDDLGEYFGSRDFTMNQIVVMDGKLQMTSQASIDIKAGIIRVCPSEIGGYDENEFFISDRIGLKALLLEASLKAQGKDARVAPTQNGQINHMWEEDGAGPFNLALMLQKSLEYGDEAAGLFWEKAAKIGAVTGDAATLARAGRWQELAGYFDDDLDYPFGYRGSALEALLGDSQWDTNDETWEDDIEHYRDVARKLGGKSAAVIAADEGRW